MIQRFKKQWLPLVISYLVKNCHIVLMAFLLVLGVLVGGILIRNDSLYDVFDLPKFFQNFIAARNSGGFSSVYVRSFLSSFLFLLGAYCSGFFVYGFIPSVLLPFVKGLGIGAVCGYVYQTFGLKGVAFAMLVVLPPAFLQGFLLMLACKASFRSSLSLAGFLIKGNNLIHPQQVFKAYNISFLILLLFAAGVALLDSILSNIFMGVFGF